MVSPQATGWLSGAKNVSGPSHAPSRADLLNCLLVAETGRHEGGSFYSSPMLPPRKRLRISALAQDSSRWAYHVLLLYWGIPYYKCSWYPINVIYTRSQAETVGLPTQQRTGPITNRYAPPRLETRPDSRRRYEPHT